MCISILFFLFYLHLELSHFNIGFFKTLFYLQDIMLVVIKKFMLENVQFYGDLIYDMHDLLFKKRSKHYLSHREHQSYPLGGCLAVLKEQIYLYH